MVLYDCRMQGLLRYHGIKGNVASGREGLETEERFDTLVDTNDQLLERIVSGHHIIVF